MPYVNPVYMRDAMYSPPNMPNMPNIQLARAYVPDQPYVGLFPPSEGLRKGTIFPNLYIPYPIKSKE
jgi:hypothetical protein